MVVLKIVEGCVGIVVIVGLYLAVTFPVNLWQLGWYGLTGDADYDLEEGLLALPYILQGRDDLVAGFVGAWLGFGASGWAWWQVLSRAAGVLGVVG